MGSRILVAGAMVAAGGLAYALVEARQYRLRRVDVPVLPPGADDLLVLHLSDLHMTPARKKLQQWVRRLDELAPDLVLTTGDNLAHADAVGPTLEALRPHLDRPGAFVLGSNDYYAPTPKNPARYLQRDDGTRVHGDELHWRPLVDAMTAAGWLDLTNARDVLEVNGLRIDLRGVDDPHLQLDRVGQVAGPPAPGTDVAIGLTHSPEPRVLDAYAADGIDLTLAGHTHGGQLCVPGYGALVTNCGLPRGQASGLSRWQSSWLHVTAGLGTSPYTPVRFACPPEATLLRLVARSTPPSG